MKQKVIVARPKTQHYLERIFLSLFLLFLFIQYAEAGKIIKWTDDNGVVHYGDVLPSTVAGKKNAELNKEGVVVKKNAQHQLSNSDQAKAQEKQLRKDSALLASYSSVEEIELAMQRNLGAEEYLLKAVYQRLLDTTNALEQKVKMRAGYQADNRDIPNYLENEINASRKQIESIKAEIVAKKNNIGLIKTRFASYKARYAELRPRNQSLTAINVHQRNLTELENWKREANKTLSYLLSQTVKYKRSGEAIPSSVVEGIKNANREIARADQEIASLRASILSSQQTFTSK